MIAIDDVLVSEDIVEKHFICNLDACKGACCWEGDYGAPMTQKEADEFEENKEKILPFMDEAGKEYLLKNATSKYYRAVKMLGTPLLRNKRCVFLTFDEKGFGLCGIEKAYKEGALPFNKPVSCHLYPIRVLKNEAQGFEAWNYDRWDICSEACKLGKKHKLPIHRFVKDAIIRYKGPAFYEALDAYYIDHYPNNE
ncbi:MAG: DUF3109 family protein [Saprospiraceae bacterium]|nr:DUF3109 family protein [Saprospiraceae bacterium]MBK7787839.1 DUF3109 family protein [Saprospiraceae bacterium]MBK8109098.1 DUF3109 family protein [Saprospiraceae bacterium]MBK8849989.1 DUF3109 family protein [Saprospiraceae bacterium]MBK9686875.1 DUF3109 family protein [Saprospiraceae bacterium]